MAINVSDIQRGMAVYGRDGEQVGTVTAVRPGGRVVTGPVGEAADRAAPATPAPPVDLDPPPSGQIGTLPLGTTTAKDRGEESALNRIALRDPHTLNSVTSSAVPGAGGMDRLRGYPLRRREEGDSTAEESARSATGSLHGAGVSETEAAMLVSEKAELDSRPDEPADQQLPDEMGSGGYFMVQDPGTLGVMAGGMRVPFAAVVAIQPGLGVTLDCSAQECRDRWKHIGLDIDETADVTPF